MSATEIVAVRRVSAYRTTDDKLHDTRPDATRHQAWLDLTAWLGNEIELTHDEAGSLARRLIEEAPGEGGILDMLKKGSR
jgi:hypothetical protein